MSGEVPPPVPGFAPPQGASPFETPPPVPEATPVELTEPPPPTPRFPRPLANPVPEGWSGIMQPGEKILWQGRPISRVNYGRILPKLAFSAFYTGFSVFWMLGASRAGGVFWMFGLIFFFVGSGMIAQTLLDERMRLRETYFTLSDRAAYIARRHWLKGRQLETYRITPALPVTLSGTTEKGDVVFASRTVKTNNGSREEPIGFLGIAGAPEVFALVMQAREARK